MTAAPFSPDDVLARLAEARAEIIASVEPLSDVQWAWSPDESTWSAAHIVEHCAVVDRGTAKMLTEKFSTLEAVDFTPEQQAKKDASIRVAVANRGVKLDAPPRVVPSGRFASRADAMAALLGARDTIADAVRTSGNALRSRGAPHPFLGKFDGLQWAVFSAEHGARHMSQLAELRAQPEFPKA